MEAGFAWPSLGKLRIAMRSFAAPLRCFRGSPLSRPSIWLVGTRVCTAQCERLLGGEPLLRRAGGFLVTLPGPNGFLDCASRVRRFERVCVRCVIAQVYLLERFAAQVVHWHHALY